VRSIFLMKKGFYQAILKYSFSIPKIGKIKTNHTQLVITNVADVE